MVGGDRTIADLAPAELSDSGGLFSSGNTRDDVRRVVGELGVSAKGCPVQYGGRIAIDRRSRDHLDQGRGRTIAMARGDQRSRGRSALLLVALWASFIVVVAILFNFVRWEAGQYELTGSTSRKAIDRE